MRLIDYLGRDIGELLTAHPFSGWQAVRSLEHEPEPKIQYLFEGHGVEVTCDGLARIATVFLHRGGDGEHLLDGLFAMGRDQVLERFGTPESSGGPSRSPVLGDHGPWDRFTLPEGALHVQYAVSRDEIDLVTLMRSDVVASLGKMPRTLNLYAGNASSGRDVMEEVLVEHASEQTFRLLRSPGLVLGMAAGDVFELQERGRFRVIERSGNLCVQIFFRGNVEDIQRAAHEILAGLGARLDGKDSKLLVFTIPLRNNFLDIEERLDRLVVKFAEASWYYGNVYDPADGKTPLNWWTSSENLNEG